MKKRTDKSILDAGLYLSHMNYYATGEGVRSCLAIGGTKERSETLIKEKLPDYFHALIVTGPAEANASQDILAMIEWLPAKVRDALAEMPPGVRVSGFLCEGPTMTMFRSPHATQEIYPRREAGRHPSRRAA